MTLLLSFLYCCRIQFWIFVTCQHSYFSLFFVRWYQVKLIFGFFNFLSYVKTVFEHVKMEVSAKKRKRHWEERAQRKGIIFNVTINIFLESTSTYLGEKNLLSESKVVLLSDTSYLCYVAETMCFTFLYIAFVSQKSFLPRCGNMLNECKTKVNDIHDFAL